MLGIPEDAVVSVRAGQVRRQASAGAPKPLRFPAEETRLKFDVLQRIGGGYVMLKKHEDSYRVILDEASEMSCEVGIRRLGGDGASKVDATPAAPDDENSFKGVQTKLAKEAQEYMESTGLLQFMQSTLHIVLKERPKDPFTFMAKHFMSGFDSPRAAEPTKPPRPAAETKAPKDQPLQQGGTEEAAKEEAVARDAPVPPPTELAPAGVTADLTSSPEVEGEALEGIAKETPPPSSLVASVLGGVAPAPEEITKVAPLLQPTDAAAPSAAAVPMQATTAAATAEAETPIGEATKEEASPPSPEDIVQEEEIAKEAPPPQPTVVPAPAIGTAPVQAATEAVAAEVKAASVALPAPGLAEVDFAPPVMLLTYPVAFGGTFAALDLPHALLAI